MRSPTPRLPDDALDHWRKAAEKKARHLPDGSSPRPPKRMVVRCDLLLSLIYEVMLHREVLARKKEV